MGLEFRAYEKGFKGFEFWVQGQELSCPGFELRFRCRSFGMSAGISLNWVPPLYMLPIRMVVIIGTTLTKLSKSV